MEIKLKDKFTFICSNEEQYEFIHKIFMENNIRWVSDKNTTNQRWYDWNDEYIPKPIVFFVKDKFLSYDNINSICLGLGNDEFINQYTLINVYDLVKDTDKEIHFYYDSDSLENEICFTTYKDTEDAINNSKNIINTTSLFNLSFDLLDKGYRIFLHKNGKTLEVKPDMECCKREIRKSDNILKMWIEGTFNEYFK